MKKAIIGKKIGMTQVFTEDGRLVPVTVIEAGPCSVVQTKIVESDGYDAVQVGFGELTETRAKKLLNKPELGHFQKAGVAAKRTLREFRFDDCSGYNVGDELKADQFALEILVAHVVLLRIELSTGSIQGPAVGNQQLGSLGQVQRVHGNFVQVQLFPGSQGFLVLGLFFIGKAFCLLLSCKLIYSFNFILSHYLYLCLVFLFFFADAHQYPKTFL